MIAVSPKSQNHSGGIFLTILESLQNVSQFCAAAIRFTKKSAICILKDIFSKFIYIVTIYFWASQWPRGLRSQDLEVGLE